MRIPRLEGSLRAVRLVAGVIAASWVLLSARQGWCRAGDVDTSFDGDGIVQAPAGRNFFDMTVQPDDKILATSYDSCDLNGCYDLKLMRFNADGSLDVTFGGGDGVVDVFIGGKPQVLNGYIYMTGDQSLARYFMDGTQDLTYGTGGLVPNPCEHSRGTLDSLGRMVSISALTVYRCDADGAPDTTFGADGQVSFTVSGPKAFETNRGIVVQPDGKIVVLVESIWEDGGEFDPGDEDDLSEDEGVSKGGAVLALVRLNTDGTRDTSFSGTGIALFAAHDYLVLGNGLFRTLDGKLVAEGYGIEVLPGDHDLKRIVLARFTSDGDRDASFGDDGVVLSEFLPELRIEVPGGVQPDGKILVAGNDQSGGTHPNNVLVRFDVDGTPDRTFGVGAIADMDTLGPFLRELQVDSAGRAVLHLLSPTIGRLRGDCARNGLVEDGEECDDGNADDADGCSNICEIDDCHVCAGSNPSDCSAFAALGTPCEDGNFCTSNDQCDGAGSCVPHPQPLASCIDAEIGKFSLGRGAIDSKDKLSWSWENLFSPGDSFAFGDPSIGGTGYTLCVFDGDGKLLQLDLPAGGECGTKRCWKADGDNEHYTYNDKALSHGGIQKLAIISDRGKFSMTGKGPNLPDATGAFVDPVTVQLIRRDDHECFQSSFTGPSIKKSTATSFRAARKP